MSGSACRSVWMATACVAIGAAFAVAATVVITPIADGTLVDGGEYGVLDGVADTADWSFNESSFEGAITLVRTDPARDQRVVFEYDLTTLAFSPPVTARLTITLRGAPRYPAQPAVVHIYTYPADGFESLADFGSEATSLVSAEAIRPYQPPTTFIFNVSDLVNASLQELGSRIAIRVQIDPGAEPDVNQVFIDAIETDPMTKPFLTIENRVPSDYDDDGDVDLDDYFHLAECIRGPSGRTPTDCSVFDADFDGDVDLLDVRAFEKDHLSY